MKDGGLFLHSRSPEAGRVMIVHGPAAIGHDIREPAFRFHVILGQDMVTDETAALALPG